jgi:hypothetical protein
VIVPDRDLPGVHGDTLCLMITDDDSAMILVLTAANAPTDFQVPRPARGGNRA